MQPSWNRDTLLINALAALVLLGRRRFPVSVLFLVMALAVIAASTALFTSGLAVAAAVAVYTSTLRLSRDRGAILTGCVAVAVGCLSLWGGDDVGPGVLVVLLGGAIGDAVRTQRGHMAALTQRAERAEATREALARQRVAEERLAIARDLHDVVAHQIAVINLQAGVVSSAIGARPADAQRGLRIIREASRTVLTEIGDLLTTLRDPDAVDTSPPGLAQLDDMVRDLAVHGMEVTLRHDGAVRGVPPRIDVAAARIVSEALTNAHKHGVEHRAHVLVERLPRSLRLTVTNPAPPGPVSDTVGTGNGLVGMRERVESVRGALTYGRDGVGTWVVVADLPVTAETIVTDDLPGDDVGSARDNREGATP